MGPKEKQNKRRLSSGGIWQLDDQQPQQVLKTEVDEVKKGAAVICSSPILGVNGHITTSNVQFF